MKALTHEQLKAIETLKELAGRDSQAIYFTEQYVEIPKEWFMSTFRPNDTIQQLFIENPDKYEMHVMRVVTDAMTLETAMYYKDYEKWVKEWEGQVNES